MYLFIKHASFFIAFENLRKKKTVDVENNSLFSQVLTKDLEKKEQAHARVLGQHHDLQRSYDQSERERERLCGQLEDSLRKLKDLAR